MTADTIATAVLILIAAPGGIVTMVLAGAWIALCARRG